MNDTIAGAAPAPDATEVVDITSQVAASAQVVDHPGGLDAITSGLGQLVANIEADARAVLDTLETMPAPTSLAHVIEDAAKVKALLGQLAQVAVDLATGLKAVAIGNSR